jgi:Protein of unknown function (DUF3465)
MRHSTARLAFLACAALVSACAAQRPDDGAVCAAYSAQRSRVEAVAGGRVTRIFGVRAGRSSPHEGFLMRLDSGCDLVLRVEVNTDFTGEIPLSSNEPIVVKGEYEYYPRGGVIHWTHHDPRGRHENGYISAADKMYY